MYMYCTYVVQEMSSHKAGLVVWGFCQERLAWLHAMDWWPALGVAGTMQSMLLSAKAGFNVVKISPSHVQAPASAPEMASELLQAKLRIFHAAQDDHPTPEPSSASARALHPYMYREDYGENSEWWVRAPCYLGT